MLHLLKGWFWLVVLLPCILAGCQHHRCYSGSSTSVPGPIPNAGGLAPVPFPGSNIPQGGPPASQGFPPPPGVLPPGPPSPGFGANTLPPANYQPPPDRLPPPPNWQAAPGQNFQESPGGKRFEEPPLNENKAIQGNRLDTRLYPPVPDKSGMGEDPLLGTSPQPPLQKDPRPDIQNQPSTTLPVGIPQFTVIKNGIATGLRPMLDGGLDWLQTHKYKPVLHLLPPGQDDGADQKQVEKRGMTYRSLEVSPESLNKETFEKFETIVSDSNNYPLFIYDSDGALVGGMWFLHFRLVDHLESDVARVRAGSLGLRENRDNLHRDMWLALQAFLARQQN